jgi:hypothetical protein
LALLSNEEKRALRHTQKLLYSSQQFPLVGGGTRRQPRRLYAKQAALLLAGGVVLALVGLIALVTQLAA